MHEIDIHTLTSETDYQTLIEQSRVDGNLDIGFYYGSDFKNAKSLRDIVTALCQVYALDTMLTSRMTLVTDEMNNNAIEYGSQAGDINCMRIICVQNENDLDLTIEVQDCGNGSQHKTALEMEQLRNNRSKEGFRHHDSIRGRGLFMIIINIVDTLYFKDSENGGLIVGIKRNIKKTQ